MSGAPTEVLGPNRARAAERMVNMPDMDIRKLDILKERLVTGTVFADILDYFLKYFGEKAAFMRLGERSDGEILKTIINEVAPDVTGTVDPNPQFRFVRLPEYHFIHGSVLVSGWIGTAFYFEDIDRGLIALTRTGRATQMYRVSASMVRMPDSSEAN